MDSQKTVVDGQLITIHSDSDDQVKTSLDMSASSSAKKRRVQRNKQSDENNITLQTLNFLKAAHEERKQLQMQSEANRDKRASETNALLLKGISGCSKKMISFSSTSRFCVPQSRFDVFWLRLI